MEYFQRQIERAIQRFSKQYPVLLLTGPRQSGKTTVLEHLADADRTYVTLDDLDALRLAKEDAKLFFQRYPGDLTIDEIQRAPELMLPIKQVVDTQKRKGQFWLTGSQGLPLMKGVSESLAGRAAVLELLPFSLAERNHADLDRQPWYPDIQRSPIQSDLLTTFEAILDGGFPTLVTEDVDRESFLTFYINTYLERDVRDLLHVGNLRDFDRFLRACAARTGQILNMNDLSRDIGVSAPTIKNWLSVLEASSQILLLEPYYRNLSQRMIKAPKLYFLNTGLVCSLTGWKSPEVAASGAMAGALFETFVLGEILKSWFGNGKRPPIYYYRTKDKSEIDFLFEIDGTLYPAEVKLAASPRKPGRPWKTLADSGIPIGPGAVICLAEERFPLAETVDAVPVGEI